MVKHRNKVVSDVYIAISNYLFAVIGTCCYSFVYIGVKNDSSFRQSIESENRRTHKEIVLTRHLDEPLAQGNLGLFILLGPRPARWQRGDYVALVVLEVQPGHALKVGVIVYVAFVVGQPWHLAPVHLIDKHQICIGGRIRRRGHGVPGRL